MTAEARPRAVLARCLCNGPRPTRVTGEEQAPCTLPDDTYDIHHTHHTRHLADDAARALAPQTAVLCARSRGQGDREKAA